MGWPPETGQLVIVLQQLKLSIEESHNTNYGYAKGGGEKHFVEHLFLLVSDLGLGQTIMICWCCLQASKGLKTGRFYSRCLMLQCSLPAWRCRLFQDPAAFDMGLLTSME